MRRLARLLAYLALVALLGLLVASIYTPREQVPLPPPPPLTGEIDRIVIEKAARRMQLFQDDKVVRTYRIALGFTPVGDKVRQGDGKTPEGEFIIDRRNDRSAFHLSLGINYPKEDDLKRASAGGLQRGRRHLHPRPAQCHRRRVQVAGRLDERLHRGNQPRDARNLGGHADRDAGGNPALNWIRRGADSRRARSHPARNQARHGR